MNIRRGNHWRRRSRLRAPSFEDTSLRVRSWIAERRENWARPVAWVRAQGGAIERPFPKPVEWIDRHRAIAIGAVVLLLAIALFQAQHLHSFGAYLVAPEALPRFWIFALGLFGSWGIAVMGAPWFDRLMARTTREAEAGVLEADLCVDEDDAVTLSAEPIVTAEAPLSVDPAAAPHSDRSAARYDEPARRYDRSSTSTPDRVPDPPTRSEPARPRAPRTPPPEPRLSRHALKQAPLCPACHNPLAMAIRREPGLGLMRVLRCETCGDDRISHPGDLGAPRQHERQDPSAPATRAEPPAAPRRDVSPFRLIGESEAAPTPHKRES